MNESKMLGDRAKTRFDPDLARRMNERADAEERRRKLEDRLKPEAVEPVEEVKPVTEDAKPFADSGSDYALMDWTKTYALGVHALRNACKKVPNCVHPTFVKKDGSSIYRPLTFEENIRARLDDYNTLNNPDGSKRSDDDRKRLFKTWLDSCTGIAYKKGTTLFKIITESEDLIRIPNGFNEDYLPVDYSQLQGIELDSSQRIYNHLLTKQQVIKHPAWNAAVTDKSLLKDYADLLFGFRDENKMIFWVRQNTSQDELRALCVYNISDYSNADGNSSLYDGGRFVRVTHVAPEAP